MDKPQVPTLIEALKAEAYDIMILIAQAQERLRQLHARIAAYKPPPPEAKVD